VRRGFEEWINGPFDAKLGRKSIRRNHRIMKKVNISINGALKQYVVNPDSVLLDLLRDELHLTGAKQSCDRKEENFLRFVMSLLT
jgi:hypothetical protein